MVRQRRFMYYVLVLMKGKVEELCTCTTRNEALEAFDDLHTLYLADFPACDFTVVLAKDGLLLFTEE